MSDYLPDSPVVSRSYCPGCEPEADPTAEPLDVRWCDPHAPVRDGQDDDRVRSQAYLSGSADAGGDDNRKICDLLHRGIKPPENGEPQKEESPCPVS